MRALGVDHIDLYQLHWPDPAVPVAETAGALQELVNEDSVGAADLRLGEAELAEIDAIMDGAVSVGGRSPESV